MKTEETTETTLFYPTRPQLEQEIWQKLLDLDHNKYIHLSKNNKGVKIEKLLPVSINELDKKNYLVSYSVNDTAVTQWIDKTRNPVEPHCSTVLLVPLSCLTTLILQLIQQS